MPRRPEPADIGLQFPSVGGEPFRRGTCLFGRSPSGLRPWGAAEHYTRHNSSITSLVHRHPHVTFSAALVMIIISIVSIEGDARLMHVILLKCSVAIIIVGCMFGSSPSGQAVFGSFIPRDKTTSSFTSSYPSSDNLLYWNCTPRNNSMELRSLTRP